MNPSLRSTVVDNLIAGTSYSFKLQAFNSAGPGPLSEKVTAATLDSLIAPGDISNVQYLISGTSLQISWDAPTKYVFLFISENLFCLEIYFVKPLS